MRSHFNLMNDFLCDLLTDDIAARWFVHKREQITTDGGRDVLWLCPRFDLSCSTEEDDSCVESTLPEPIEADIDFDEIGD